MVQRPASLTMLIFCGPRVVCRRAVPFSSDGRVASFCSGWRWPNRAQISAAANHGCPNLTAARTQRPLKRNSGAAGPAAALFMWPLRVGVFCSAQSARSPLIPLLISARNAVT